MRAVLFRSLSRALPLWAIEGVPGLFVGLFVTARREAGAFVRVVATITEATAPRGFGVGVEPGKN